MFEGKNYCDVSTNNSVLDLVKVVFGRRNSDWAFYMDEFSNCSFGHSRLYIGLCSYLVGSSNRNRLMAVQAVHDGIEVPYAVEADYTAVRIKSLYGFAEFCIAQEDMLRIRGKGIALRIRPEINGHESAKSREEGCFEVDLGMINEKFLFMPIEGKLAVDTAYDYKKFGIVHACVDFVPTAGADFEGAIKHFRSNAAVIKDFKPFDDCISEIQGDLDAWIRKLPEVPERYSQTFYHAAFMIWSNVMKHGGNIREDLISVDQLHCAQAYSWQQCFHAIVHHKDITYAWNLVAAYFDYQDEAGQLPESVNEYFMNFQTCKPPLQGFTINWLMDHCDMSGITHEQYERVYEPLGKWTDWWMTCCDRSHKGLPAYDHGDDSGLDDTPLFRAGVPLYAPDLAAYLVLQMEASARIAHILGREEENCQWMSRADKLLNKMIETYWDGERFVAYAGENMETVAAESVQCYVPLLLGKRLPRQVIDKLCASLAEQDKFITPYGLATEALDSRFLDLSDAWTRGTINAPNQFILALALMECGEKALASRIASSYCDTVKKYGPCQHFDPFTGEPVVPFGFFRQHFQPWTSWASGVFLVLATLCD